MPFSGCFVGANPKVWASSTRKKTFYQKREHFMILLSGGKLDLFTNKYETFQ